MFMDILGRFRIDINNSIVLESVKMIFCRVKFAGKGISFNSTKAMIDDIADYIIRNHSLAPIMLFCK